MHHPQILQTQIDVTIIVPTYQRSAALKNLLDSISKKLQTNHNVRVLIVDNNPLPQERTFVEKYAKPFRFPLDYIHEPNSGVSHARNSGLSYTNTRYAAFLDDDMEISPGWLDSLMSVAHDHNTAVTFGPVRAKFPKGFEELEDHIGAFYSRSGPEEYHGIVSDVHGTGGALLDMSQIRPMKLKFDPQHNASGGEDDVYFAQLESAGLTFGWSSQAETFEIVPPHRLTKNYIFRRNFGYGQAPSRTSNSKGLIGLPTLLRHMCVGLVQLFIFAPLYFILKVLKKPSALKYLGLSSRGLGKVFFANNFRPHLYGPSRIIKKN